MNNKIKKMEQFLVEDYNKYNFTSTSNIEMYNILKDLPYIKFIDRPSGHYLHSIDLTITDIDYIEDFKKIVNDNKWYIERGKNKNYTISQIYIKDAESSIPEKLYHITPTIHVENILKDGLLPKSDDIRHKYPPRIYVSDNVVSLTSLSNELMRWKSIRDYTILEINTTGLKFKLYKDTTSAYKGHYYIQDIDKIPSENISIFKK